MGARMTVVALLLATACSSSSVKKQLRSMAVAPVSRDDWWEPRRDPDPNRPLGAEITSNPYQDKDALFAATPEQARLMNTFAPIAAFMAIFAATGQVPAVLWVSPPD